MGLEKHSTQGFGWQVACAVACTLLVASWHAPVRAQAAGLAHVPVAGQRSCAVDSSMYAGAAVAVAEQVRASGARIALNRVEGPPGTQLTLSGSRWPAGATVTIDLIAHNFITGQVFVGQPGIARAMVESDGSFHTRTFDAPQQHSCGGNGYGVPDSVVQYVAHTADNAVNAEAQFRYLPAPQLGILSPGDNGQNLAPGAPLAITGLHWEPGVEVTLTASTIAHPTLPPESDNMPTHRDQDTVRVLADATGAFHVTMRMPVDLAPRTGYMIMASSSGPQFGTLKVPGRTFVALPVALPTLTLDRSEGTAGSSVLMSGAHWMPGDVVQLEYCRGEQRTFGANGTDLRCDPFATQGLGEARVRQDGRIQARVTLPTAARLGIVTMQARVVNDFFGLMIYAQAQTLTIVPPPVPWTTEYPLLTRVAEITGLLAFLAVAVALCVWQWWRRRNARHLREAETGMERGIA